MNSFRALSALLVAAGLLAVTGVMALAAEPVEAMVRERSEAIAQVQDAHMRELAAMAHLPVVRDYFKAHDKERKSRLNAVQTALAGRQMGAELCLIDHHGSEHLRAVRGHLASDSELAHNEVEAPFFKDGIHLAEGQNFQSAPYASPDVEEWVLGYVVPVIPGQAILHFEHPLKEIQALATQGITGNDRFVLVVDEQGLIFGDSRRHISLSTIGDSPDPKANFQNMLKTDPPVPPALVADILSDQTRTAKTNWNGGTWEVAWKHIGALVVVGFQRQP